MMSNAFSYIFLFFVLSAATIKLWLSWRQITTVKSHEGKVPKAFSEDISLDAHQKAAHYTVAKMKLSKQAMLQGLSLVAGGAGKRRMLLFVILEWPVVMARSCKVERCWRWRSSHCKIRARC